MIVETLKTCECGCGNIPKLGNRYIFGHSGGRVARPESILTLLCPECGKKFQCFKSTPTMYCNVKCYAAAKKGMPLTFQQIEGYKKRVIVPWSKGLTKADDCRLMKLSIDRTGKGNPNAGKYPSQKTINLLSKALTGIKRSALTKARMRKARALMLEKGFVGSCGCYKSGKLFLSRLGITLHYRSSYEKQALLLLDSCLDVTSILVECLQIVYFDDCKQEHFYIPDYVVTTNEGTKYIIEVKPEYIVKEKVNQLKFKVAYEYAKEHGMVFCVWTENILFNNNSVTTVFLQEIVEATVAILSVDGKIMIQSELYSNVEKGAEMTPSPKQLGLQVTGCNLENEVVKYLGGEARWTVDHYGIDLMDDASYGSGAAATITAWNAVVGSGKEWLWIKHEFLDRIEEGNNNIIEKTLRAMATFIVAGSNVIRVLRQLPNFKPASLGKTPPTGPYKAGTLDGRVVIHDPFLKNITVDGTAILGTNRYIMGYKGDNFLMSGFIHAPYIPLFTTPTLVTNDLMAQKGFYSASGFKVVNAGMFTYGKITNLGTSA
jgi:hypothetical protein